MSIVSCINSPSTKPNHTVSQLNRTWSSISVDAFVSTSLRTLVSNGRQIDRFSKLAIVAPCVKHIDKCNKTALWLSDTYGSKSRDHDNDLCATCFFHFVCPDWDPGLGRVSHPAASSRARQAALLGMFCFVASYIADRQNLNINHVTIYSWIFSQLWEYLECGWIYHSKTKHLQLRIFFYQRV